MTTTQNVSQTDLREIMEFVRSRRASAGRSAVWAPKASWVAPLLKGAWAAVVFVFCAGATLQYYSSVVVLQDEFTPVKMAVSQVPEIVSKLEELEKRYGKTSADVASVNVKLATIGETLHRISSTQTAIRDQYNRAAICAMHRDAFLRQLVDYAAKVRKKPPQETPAYTSCVSAMSGLMTPE